LAGNPKRGKIDTLQARNRLLRNARECYFGGDGRSADGWVHEVGMYADVAIVWQGPTVSSVRVVGAPD